MGVRWGMLSTASIGREVAAAIKGSASAKFVAVAGRDATKAARYAGSVGMLRSFGSYDELPP
jgi:xylose dehydrogenase (NAD/NADP)